MSLLTLGAYAAAFILTLVLASFLTPRTWWRQLNLRALTVVGAGTWAIASLILWLAPAATPVLAATHGVAAPRLSAQRLHFRVFDDLNLRAGRGTAAPRVAVVPAGALVTTTGLRDGDWWQVSAQVDGRTVVGWSSSLWLRRVDEVNN